MERFRQVLSILHQLVGISDVGQADPEHGPLPDSEAAVALLEVPEREQAEVQRSFSYISNICFFSSLFTFI